MRALTEGLQLGGRYTLQKRLGGGGMSAVWLAWDARSDGSVALKFLSGDTLEDSHRRKLFHDEWRIGSRLMHAHIARVFEYHDDEDGPYYGQQFIDGRSLSELAGQPLDIVLRPLGLLADALRYAHGKDIVHGDVTSANVLLDARGAPYLVDFGIARDADSGLHSGGGTPAAQSPQQRRGEPATAADDMYAFGVLIHELLFGRPPAAGETLPESTTAGDKLPGALRALLDDLLAEDTGRRPSAESVKLRLAEAGFPAATAPATARPTTAVADEIAVQSVRPRATQMTAAASPASSDDRGGVPVTGVAVGLVVLLAAFLVVLFVLPPGDEPGSATEQASETQAADPADVAGTPLPGEPADGESAGEDGAQGLPGDNSDAAFSENVGQTGGSSAARLKAATDEALGDLLSRLERLRYRGIERWGGQEYLDALDRYAAGDEAYLNRNYETAGEHYRAAIDMFEPFFDRIDDVFRETMQEAKAAFEARDHREAIRLYDLAVAITPGNPEAETGLARAQSLEDVLRLMERGRELEKNLDFEAARQAFSNVLDLDPAWQPAEDALERVRTALAQLDFERRMTEGFDALAAGNLETARAAFESARAMRPSSDQPVDGLLQVDQAARLQRIRELEQTAARQEQNERWEAAVESYEEVLSVDPDLRFAQDGLRRASERAALHRQLDEYIDNPDKLSEPAVMQAATRMFLNLSRIDPTGPRLEDQKEALSRLLKRAATPLPVKLVSDNQTQVSIYRVGQLGSFESRQLELRPGTYVAVGSRAGYRDVRLEFRVGPEIEMKPIVVQCEERI